MCRLKLKITSLDHTGSGAQLCVTVSCSQYGRRAASAGSSGASAWCGRFNNSTAINWTIAGGKYQHSSATRARWRPPRTTPRHNPPDKSGQTGFPCECAPRCRRRRAARKALRQFARQTVLFAARHHRKLLNDPAVLRIARGMAGPRMMLQMMALPAEERQKHKPAAQMSGQSVEPSFSANGSMIRLVQNDVHLHQGKRGQNPRCQVHPPSTRAHP